MEATIQAAIARAFELFSDNTAAEYGEESITYERLRIESSQLSRFINRPDNQAKKIIGILLDNGIEFILAVIGILKSGNIFMPLDIKHPVKRLQDMLEAVKADYIITDRENMELAAELSGEGGIPMLLDRNELKQYPEAENVSGYNGNDPVYIFFTSGTAGKPKAILGKNKSLLHFITWEANYLGLTEGTRFSQFTSTGFDAVLRDIFTPVSTGGTICIPPKREILLDAGRLSGWIDRERINVIHCTPTLFHNFNMGITEKSYEDLHYVLLAGERIVPRELKNWYDTFQDRIQLINLYGPTETTMVKTYYSIAPSDVNRSSIPIGRAMDGTAVHILDERRRTCEAGAEGEIYIETEYMTFGYYGNEELNKESFLHITMDNGEKKYVYRTGDCGRLLDDGCLEYRGRKDRQVKIRGNRVEPGEIENIILTLPGITKCYVHYSDNEEKNDVLTAYCVKNTDISEERLFDFIRYQLPDYMLPANIVFLDKIPMDANGKADVRALPAPAAKARRRYAPPQDDIEVKLIEIWNGILEREDIGVTDSFLQIGGHSLNIMTMISQIYDCFEVELPLEIVFDRPDIKSIASYIRESDNVNPRYDIQPVEIRDYYPISPAQRRIFISEQLDNKGTAYNITNSFTVRGRLDEERLRRALERLADRHEALRTSFHVVDGEIYQKIHGHIDSQLVVHECGEAGAEAVIDGFIKPFDIEKAPLFRLCLLSVDEDKSILAMDMHHLISDGKSVRILLRDLLLLYKAKEELPKPAFRYVDYVSWYNKRISDKKAEYEEYWLNRLKDMASVKGLPIDYAIQNDRTYSGGSLIKELPADILNSLNKCAIQNKTTLFILMFAVYSVLYAKYTAQEDIIIGSPVEGRRNHKLEDIVGMFINVIPVRSNPTMDKSFADYLNEMKTIILEGFEHEDYQIDELISKLHLKDNFNGRYLFDTLFSMQYFEALPSGDMDISFDYFDKPPAVESENLRVILYHTPDKLLISYSYSREIFKEETMERMLKDYIRLMEIVTDNIAIRLKDIELYDNAAGAEPMINTDLPLDFNF